MYQSIRLCFDDFIRIWTIRSFVSNEKHIRKVNPMRYFVVSKFQISKGLPVSFVVLSFFPIRLAHKSLCCKHILYVIIYKQWQIKMFKCSYRMILPVSYKILWWIILWKRRGVKLWKNVLKCFRQDQWG